jgi:hypothetical protein
VEAGAGRGEARSELMGLFKGCCEMSRRDGAIVAWHEVPGTGPSQKSRPVGYGVIRAGSRDALVDVWQTHPVTSSSLEFLPHRRDSRYPVHLMTMDGIEILDE